MASQSRPKGIAQPLNESQQIHAMLKSILTANDQLANVNQVAYGCNEGGQYVSLFSSYLKFRICNVYEENFGKLPAYLVAMIPPKENVEGREIGGEREKAEKKGLLVDIPWMTITRFKRDASTDMDAWRLIAVIHFTLPQAQAQPAPAQAPAPAPAPAKLIDSVEPLDIYGGVSTAWTEWTSPGDALTWAEGSYLFDADESPRDCLKQLVDNNFNGNLTTSNMRQVLKLFHDVALSRKAARDAIGETKGPQSAQWVALAMAKAELQPQSQSQP
jgi:hypothetical protein